MYVKQNKTASGRIYLDYYRSFRDQHGKNRNKLVQRIGYLDVLQAEFDDPIAHFKAEAIRLTALEKQDSSLSLKFDIHKKLPSNFQNTKNLGYIFLQTIYYSLGLDDFFSRKQRQLNVHYNLNNIMRLLTYSRILFPASKAATFDSSSIFFESFASSLDSVYDSLSRVSAWKDDLQTFLHESIQAAYGKRDSLAYFDCTNYYFEIHQEDDIRKYGPSKEHRKSPIIQMGLLMDTNGIPMAYHLFPGNESEKLHLRPVINRCKLDYNLERVVVVADRGLNTSDNIFYTHGKGDGYIYSQTIRGSAKEYKEWVLDEQDYQENLEHSDCIKEKDEVIDCFKIKSRVIGKTIQIEDENGNRNHEVTIKQKQIAYYSPKFARRSRMQRQEAIAKAQYMIAHRGSYTNASHYGSMKYIKEDVIDQETGELKVKKANQNVLRYLDEETIREEEKYDGYYSIVTSEIDKSAEEIIETYRGLWKIEESFKITKSELEARPVYLSRPERIEAHFMTCFLSLVLLRVLEMETKHAYSTRQLITSMKKFEYANIQENLYQCLYRDEVIEKLNTLVGGEFDYQYRTLEQIKKLLSKSKK